MSASERAKGFGRCCARRHTLDRATVLGCSAFTEGESDMTVILLRFLWTHLRRGTVALTRVRILGEAEQSTQPHHLVFIGF
jgi:hypothetical protein